ncbi:MAG: M67 family metallopeptidase [Helicobacteraceae bacterium]|nr:M67 family metallopeptidase [Helicobacteraceae bacterium]
MIKIPREIIDAIVAHAQKDSPIEACGYLAGEISGAAAEIREVKKIYQMSNADKSEEHFAFDPQEQFNAFKDAIANKMKLIACYHSHPATPARPSEEDIRLAYDPNISYVIVSIAEGKPVVKSFRIKNGAAENEEIV